MKILFVGGGSGGPVMPLLAVAEEIKVYHPKVELFFVGTNNGPERAMAKNATMSFFTIPAGKLRRYFSLLNITTPFLVVAGFLKSLFILRRINPNCVVGAGGFVQVPLMWAAWVLRIPIIIHQQDVYPTLANKLCSAIASKITVAFEQSLKDFPESFGFLYKKPQGKVVWTGNPFFEKFRLLTKEQGLEKFGLNSNLPVLYVTGGGTGAKFINALIKNALPQLSEIVQIIHSTGKGKIENLTFPNYHAFEFIENPGFAYAAADIVISRAGLSTITELANLSKISIIIPMSKTHQEYNAELLAQQQAAIVLQEEDLTPELLPKIIRKILFSRDWQELLTKNISKLMPVHSGQKIAEIITKIAELQS